MNHSTELFLKKMLSPGVKILTGKVSEIDKNLRRFVLVSTEKDPLYSLQCTYNCPLMESLQIGEIIQVNGVLSLHPENFFSLQFSVNFFNKLDKGRINDLTFSEYISSSQWFSQYYHGEINRLKKHPLDYLLSKIGLICFRQVDADSFSQSYGDILNICLLSPEWNIDMLISSLQLMKGGGIRHIFVFFEPEINLEKFYLLSKIDLCKHLLKGEYCLVSIFPAMQTCEPLFLKCCYRNFETLEEALKFFKSKKEDFKRRIEEIRIRGDEIFYRMLDMKNNELGRISLYYESSLFCYDLFLQKKIIFTLLSDTLASQISKKAEEISAIGLEVRQSVFQFQKLE